LYWSGGAPVKAIENYTDYIIGRDGRIQRRVDFVSPDDDYARQIAKRMVAGYVIELWQRARKIERFEPDRSWFCKVGPGRGAGFAPGSRVASPMRSNQWNARNAIGKIPQAGTEGYAA
jgi:hypothetical protein